MERVQCDPARPTPPPIRAWCAGTYNSAKKPAGFLLKATDTM